MYDDGRGGFLADPPGVAVLAPRTAFVPSPESLAPISGLGSEFAELIRVLVGRATGARYELEWDRCVPGVISILVPSKPDELRGVINALGEDGICRTFLVPSREEAARVLREQRGTNPSLAERVARANGSEKFSCCPLPERSDLATEVLDPAISKWFTGWFALYLADKEKVG